jgi:adenylosuccinate synthase
MDVDDVTLVIRAFPIRVPGDSGPLPGETSWEVVAEEGGHTEPFVEYTSVTKSIRRVARFDAAVVKAAIEANNPTRIVLNHLDYTDAACVNARALTTKSIDYLKGVEDAIGRKVDFVGLGPDSLLEVRHQLLRLRA